MSNIYCQLASLFVLFCSSEIVHLMIQNSLISPCRQQTIWSVTLVSTATLLHPSVIRTWWKFVFLCMLCSTCFHHRGRRRDWCSWPTVTSTAWWPKWMSCSTEWEKTHSNTTYSTNSSLPLLTLPQHIPQTIQTSFFNQTLSICSLLFVSFTLTCASSLLLTLLVCLWTW